MCDTYMCSGKSSVLQRRSWSCSQDKRVSLQKENSFYRRDCIAMVVLMTARLKQTNQKILFNYITLQLWIILLRKDGLMCMLDMAPFLLFCTPPPEVATFSMYDLSLIQKLITRKRTWHWYVLGLLTNSVFQHPLCNPFVFKLFLQQNISVGRPSQHGRLPNKTPPPPPVVSQQT